MQVNKSQTIIIIEKLMGPDFPNPLLHINIQAVLAAHAQVLSYCPHIMGKNTFCSSHDSSFAKCQHGH